MISKRAQNIDSSGIRRVFDLAANLKNPINLSIGQPAFDAPEVMKKAAIEAIQNGRNGYTVTQGLPELRAKVLGKYGVPTGSKDIDAFMTSGVSGGLLLCYLAMLDPGDEILIPDPFFCMYRDLAVLINAVPVYYDTYPKFSLNVETIEAAITPKTRAILINSPANPTGYALTQAELGAVVELAKRKGIWLIYDEIYDAYCYDYAHAECFGKYEKTVVLNGMSKSHGVPGWRLGYAIGPKELVQQMLKIQQYSFVCTPSIAQWGALAGFDAIGDDLLVNYRKKRDVIYEGLKDSFEVIKPTGAFYIFPKAPGGDGQAFVERCIKNNLLVVPGNVFSKRNSHFRISFSASLEQLEKGIEVLRKLT